MTALPWHQHGACENKAGLSVGIVLDFQPIKAGIFAFVMHGLDTVKAVFGDLLPKALDGGPGHACSGSEDVG